jgi:hypothetical protein
MKRRDFLITAAAVTGLAGTATASGQTDRPDAKKLARISMMTLNFTALLKTPGQLPGPERTLDLFDLPEMYADTYGVHNIELQHYHMASTEPSYFAELRRRMDRANSKATQLVVEFGGLNISAPDHNFLPRLQAIDLTKVWIDRCAVLDCPRIMVNQGQPSQENRGMAVETLKAMVEYGKTRNVKVTMETRGGGAGRGAASAATGASAPAAPPAPSEPAWVLLNEIIKSAGAFINIDMGGIGAANQEDLHTALRALLPTTSGSMHVRQSAAWDLATALKFIESLGYTGIYSIEARGHEATRAIYDAILASI